MNCPSCKTDLGPGAKFCGICGARLDGPAASASPSPQPMAPKVAPAAPQSRPAGKGGGGGLSHAPEPSRSSGPAPMPVGGLDPHLGGGDDPYIGQTLNNRFRIESKLGEGGFGAVYKGTQLGIGRDVALKLLHPEMTRDKNLVARFRREGVVLCSLRDAHTITTYDFDQTPDGTLYIAMELLEGKSLHEVFHSEAPIEWKRMFKIVAEMCTSLHEAHQSGVVHRDLKPENINLERRPGNPEFVKILDFGIAKVMRGDGTGGNQSPQLTATGQTLGTLEYMSPEQLMGKDLDGRSDLYALGVLSYEMTTGRLPFPDAVGPAALISAQLRSVPEPPSKALSTAGIPPAVDTIILRMLEKDRKNRFADVMELKAACEEAIRSGGAGAPQPTAAARDGQATIALKPSAGVDARARASEMQHQQQHQQHQQHHQQQQQQQQQHMPPQQQYTPRPQSHPGAPNVPYGHAPQGKPPTARDAMSTQQMLHASTSSRMWLWVILVMAVVGGGVGAFFALR
jgi:serine/threonine-protein kinase